MSNVQFLYLFVLYFSSGDNFNQARIPKPLVEGIYEDLTGGSYHRGIKPRGQVNAKTVFPRCSEITTCHADDMIRDAHEISHP